MKLKNVTGYTTLIIIGFISLFIAGTGEWPDEINALGIGAKNQKKPKKMSTSNTALKWKQGDKESAISRGMKLSKSKALPDSNQIARDFTKIGKYDEDLINAILSNFPKAKLLRNPIIANSTADFMLTIENRSLYVETRNLIREDSNFQGKTLDSILNIFPKTSLLLVITNSNNVTTAKNKVKASLETRGDVITWIDESDNPILKATILDLLIQ